LEVLMRKEQGARVHNSPEARRRDQNTYMNRKLGAAGQGNRAQADWLKKRHPLGFRPMVPRPLEQVASELTAMVMKYKVQGIIVGLPLELDGTRGEACLRVDRFIDDMRREGGFGRDKEPHIMWLDERRSTQMARKMLEMYGSKKAQKDKSMLDKMCACFILNQWIANHLKPP
jgi:putative Holliday junction resolvase